MQICHTVAAVRSVIRSARQAHKTVGLVPTMGALHEGHASLISASVEENGFTVVSLFVNPTQFGPSEDLAQYPRTLQADFQLCEQLGADVVFQPAVEEIYPPGSSTWVTVEGDVTNGLCANSRPTHFRGVTTVVSKLFNIIQPDRAYFGQKDAQQAQIVKKMVRDLLFNIDIIAMPIIRDPDGLAKSSRNAYLTPEQRTNALVLSRTLKYVRQLAQQGEHNPHVLLQTAKDLINAQPDVRMDYAEIRQLPDLTRCSNPLCGENLLAVAAYLNSTRLIDNIVLEIK